MADADVQMLRRRRMAQMMGLNPHNPSSWPDKLIAELIELEARDGRRALFIELGRLMTPSPKI